MWKRRRRGPKTWTIGNVGMSRSTEHAEVPQSKSVEGKSMVVWSDVEQRVNVQPIIPDK